MSTETPRQLSPGQKLPKNFLKSFLIHLLQALDFLHTDAQVIYAGVHGALKRKLEPSPVLFLELWIRLFSWPDSTLVTNRVSPGGEEPRSPEPGIATLARLRAIC